MDTSIANKVFEELKILPQDLQKRVLEYTHALGQLVPHGTPGRNFLRFAGTIPPDDLELMRQEIEQSCERVDINAW